jgi:hypothetical protein
MLSGISVALVSMAMPIVIAVVSAPAICSAVGGARDTSRVSLTLLARRADHSSGHTPPAGWPSVNRGHSISPSGFTDQEELEDSYSRGWPLQLGQVI